MMRLLIAIFAWLVLPLASMAGGTGTHRSCTFFGDGNREVVFYIGIGGDVLAVIDDEYEVELSQVGNQNVVTFLEAGNDAPWFATIDDATGEAFAGIDDGHGWGKAIMEGRCR